MSIKHETKTCVVTLRRRDTLIEFHGVPCQSSEWGDLVNGETAREMELAADAIDLDSPLVAMEPDPSGGWRIRSALRAVTPL